MSPAPQAALCRDGGDAGPTMDAPVFERIERLIEQRLQEKLPIGQMAKAAHMSSRCFYRQFKRRAGLPPGAYLIARRLTRATELLDTTRLPIHQIARSSGFRNHGYFIRCFKKLTGRTPSQHRADAALRPGN